MMYVVFERFIMLIYLLVCLNVIYWCTRISVPAYVEIGTYSCKIPVNNGIRQDGILSPTLSCIYSDGLFNTFVCSEVGCYTGLTSDH